MRVERVCLWSTRHRGDSCILVFTIDSRMKNVKQKLMNCLILIQKRDIVTVRSIPRGWIFLNLNLNNTYSDN